MSARFTLSGTGDRIENTIDRIAEENQKVVIAQQKTEAGIQELKTTIAELAKEHEKTEVPRQKTEATQQETDRQIKELNKKLTSIGITIEDTAEDLFRRDLKGALTRRGIVIDRVMNNIQYSEGEFDLFSPAGRVQVPNGTYVVLIEVKDRLRASDINFFLKKQVPDFRKYFTEYKEQKLIGGLASTSTSSAQRMAINQKLERRVEESGLFLFTQTEEGGASIANRPDFNPTFY